MNYKNFEKSSLSSSLNKEQMAFFKEVAAGNNIFLTGEAGSGKSFCTKILKDFLNQEGIPYGIAASTGVAALNVDGLTIHSWAGMGLADESVDSIINNSVNRNKKARARIRDSKILIIDEISMLSADFLDKLNEVLQYFRFDMSPFGGMQMIFVGDFLQLPPVFKTVNQKGFCFESSSWKNAKIKNVVLKTVMRQDNSSDFARMLNDIRLGKTDSLSVLQSRVDAKFPNDGIQPIKIYCKNVDVDTFNKQELLKIKEESRHFHSIDNGSEHHIKFFDRNCPAPKILELKKGAQVMLLKNIDLDRGLVNGSIGKVESFCTAGVEVKFSAGKAIVEIDEWSIKEQAIGFDKKTFYKKIATREQIPLKLAWASTVHKCQGSTLDRVELDLNEAFATGQVYVALSRVRNLESLSVKPFSKDKIIVNKECLNFYEKSN